MTYKALLIDGNSYHADQLQERMKSLGVATETVRSPERALTMLKRMSETFDLVIVNVSNGAYPWLRTLRGLRDAAFQQDRDLIPKFLCVSKTKQAPEFVLSLEEIGARYVLEG